MRQVYSELRCLIGQSQRDQSHRDQSPRDESQKDKPHRDNLQRPASQGLTLGSRTMAAARDLLDSLAVAGEDLSQPEPSLDRLLLQRSRDLDDSLSLLCLRCRLSHPIEARLRALLQQHGERYGLDLITMASFVLDDAGDPDLRRGLPFRWSTLIAVPQRPLQPFSAEVLRSYRPELCGLPHWARQKVQSHAELKAYLQQQGLLLISDWTLLAYSSPTRVRAALQRCGTVALPLEQALALHNAYGVHYRRAKAQHREQLGKSSDWRPTARFFRALAPAADPLRCQEQLLAIATAVRRYLTAPPVPLDAPSPGSAQSGLSELADRRTPHLDDDDTLPAEELLARIERALAHACPPAVQQALADDRPRWAKDPSRLLAWRLYGEGLGQRAIAERCSHQQAWVSKLLQERRLATTIATAAALALLRDPAFAALGQRVETSERLVEALRNHLVDPKPEGGVAPLRVAVARALPTAAPSPAP